MLYLNPRNMLYSNPPHMLYSNPRHMVYSDPRQLYSNPRQMFIRIIVICYNIIILFNAFINHIHKQSVMTGTRDNIITSYKCHITSPKNFSFNSQVKQGHLMIDHHPLLKSNCSDNVFITVEPLIYKALCS